MKYSGNLRQDFIRDGYLIVESLVPSRTLKILKTEIDNIVANPAKIPSHLLNNITFEKDLLKRQPERSELTLNDVGEKIYLIGDLLPFSDTFVSLIYYNPLLDLIETLLDTSEFEFHFCQALIKNPRIGSRVNWHRDFGNGITDRLTSNTCRVMLCLDGMTEDNGATQVIKGSHKISDEEAKKCKPNKNQDWAKQDIITLSCPPGSAVILSSKIIHGGGPNRSSLPRRNLISEWAGFHNHVIAGYRYFFQGIKPRSKDPKVMQQNSLIFDSLPPCRLQGYEIHSSSCIVLLRANNSSRRTRRN